MTRKATHRPRKKWGQNFLTDTHLAQQIARSIETSPPLVVLEIGPGKGMLTRYLLTLEQPVVGIEIDRQLADELVATFGGNPHFQLVVGDVLEVDWERIFQQFPEHTPVVVGNIPYNITSPILFKIFDHAPPIREAIIMVQKEVALRLTASPGSKDYGILSIMAAVNGEVSYLFTVPAGRFFPKPAVDSAVVRFQFPSPLKETIRDMAWFKKIVRAAFQQRRKMLKNSLIPLLPPAIVDKLKVNWRLRPEQLDVKEWIALSNQVWELVKQNELKSS